MFAVCAASFSVSTTTTVCAATTIVSLPLTPPWPRKPSSLQTLRMHLGSPPLVR